MEALQSFVRLCENLEGECENELYTLSELFDIMVGLAKACNEDSSTYGKAYLKELLQRRYGNIFILFLVQAEMMLSVSETTVSCCGTTNIFQIAMKEKAVSLKGLLPY